MNIYRKLFIHLIFATKDRINFLPPFILSSWTWNQLGFSLLLYAALILGANTHTRYMFDYDKHESKRDLYAVLGELAKFSGDKETFNFFCSTLLYDFICRYNTFDRYIVSIFIKSIYNLPSRKRIFILFLSHEQYT